MGGSGAKASSGRARIASRARSSLARSAPAAPRPGGSPPSSRMRGSIAGGVGADRRREGRELLRGAGDHEGHRPREDRRVGLGVGAAADADQGLADHVMEGEHPRVDRVAAEDRAEGQRGAVALGAILVEGGGDQLGAAQRGHPRDRVGERRVEGVGPVGKRVHRARPQRPLRAGWSSRRGRRSPGRGGPGAPTRSSAPAGRRWMPVISAPDIVVGIAATRAPVTEATALAVSITRPPPRATRWCEAEATSSSAAAASGTWPGATSCTARGSARQPSRARKRPRVRQQLERAKPCSRSSCGACSTPPVAKGDGAAGVPPDEVAVHSAERTRGFTTGRRFGSTSARRCS